MEGGYLPGNPSPSSSPGELFLGAPPDKLTLEEARAYCQERGAEIATTGQLYAAWDGGLDRCSPGWLADGSVRYPIVTPSQRCGGGLPGVKTLFLFPNQTGFPNKHSRFNVYCFRGEPSSPAKAETHLREAELSLAGLPQLGPVLGLCHWPEGALGNDQVVTSGSNSDRSLWLGLHGLKESSPLCIFSPGFHICIPGLITSSCKSA